MLNQAQYSTVTAVVKSILRKQVILKIVCALGIYLLLATVAMQGLISSPGVIGLRHDWSTPPFDSQLASRIAEPFFLWNSNGYPVERPALLYYRLFEDLLIFASSGSDIHISKLAIFSLITLAGILSYYSLRLLKFGFLGSVLAGVFYLSTPIVFNRIIAGYLPYLFSYAIMPLVIAFFILSVREKSYKKALISGILFALAVAQLQFIVMISLLILTTTILYIVKTKSIRPAKFLTIVFAIVTILHSFWLLPLLVDARAISSIQLIAPAGYHEILNSPSVAQSLAMIGYTHQYDYSRILSDEHQAFLIIPVIIGLASFFFRHYGGLSDSIRLIGIISIVTGIFLVSATKSPLGDLWSYLYDNVFVMQLLREVYHATALIAFGSLLLIAVTLESAFRLLNSKKYVVLAGSAVFAGFVLLAQPMYSGNFHNQIQNHQFPSEYDLANYGLDYGGTRLLMIPSFDPVKYDGLDRAHIDPMLSYPVTNSFPQAATPDNRLSQFRNYLLTEVNTPQFKQGMQLTAVKYIVIRKDVSTAYFGFVPPSPNGSPFLPTAAMLQSIDMNFQKVVENEKIIIYESIENGFFDADHGFIIATGNYQSLGSILQLTDEPVILTSELLIDNTLNRLHPLNRGEGPVVIASDHLNEFLFSSTRSKQFFSLTSDNLLPDHGWTSTPATWWWKEAFIAETAPFNNIVFNTGKSSNSTFQQVMKVSANGTYKIFVRVLENPDGGHIRISVDDSPFAVHTLGDSDRFVWKELGELSLEKGDHRFLMDNLSGFNAVNGLVLASGAEYEEAQNKLVAHLERNTIIYLFNEGTHLPRSVDNPELSRTPENVAASIPTGIRGEPIMILKDGYYDLSLSGNGIFNVTISNHSFVVNLPSAGSTSGVTLPLTTGEHTLQIGYPDLIDLAQDLSLDYGEDHLQSTWVLGNDQNFEITIGSDNNMDRTFDVMTSVVGPSQWSWIRSAPIEVFPNTTYSVTTQMKYQNTNATHIKLEAFYPDTNEWRQLLPFIPGGGTGDSDWMEYSAKITIPNNVSMLRVVLNAGWVLDTSRGQAITQFGDIDIYPVTVLPELQSVLLYPTTGESGVIRLSSEGSIPVISSEKNNPTQWNAKIDAKTPFILSFAEGYDPRWEAVVYKDGKVVEVSKSIPLYSAMNGFPIDSVGDLDVVIRYTPQQWFNLGLMLSLVAFVSIVALLTYPYYKRYVGEATNRLLIAGGGD